MWQVSDKVPPGIVTAVTRNCDRPDCVLSARIIGETTCKGTSDHYNKHGQFIISDTNNFTAEVLCGACGGAFLVSQHSLTITVKDITAEHKARLSSRQIERRGY